MGLVVRYGTVKAQKSSNLIGTYHRHIGKGETVLTFISSIGARQGESIIESRSHEKIDAILLKEEDSIINYVNTYLQKDIKPTILIDEVQFLSPEQALEIIELSKYALVYVYGLKADFKGLPWTLMATLINFATKVEELTTVCEYCDNIATFNLKLENGQPTVKGSSIQADSSIDSTQYVPACMDCYFKLTYKSL